MIKQLNCFLSSDRIPKKNIQQQKSMESGGLHGYHHKLPTLSSSSSSSLEMNNHPTINVNNKSNKNKSTRNAGEEEECKVREQDRFMPIANVIRIMRRMVPAHAKISDDAKETMQECVSEFIGFVTGEANDRCQREQRKTITAEDVLYAMSKLGFDAYVDPLSLFLHRYRDLESGALDSRAPANRANYDYGPNHGFVAHQPQLVYHHPPAAAAGYYGPPGLPPPPGFDSPYGQHHNKD